MLGMTFALVMLSCACACVSLISVYSCLLLQNVVHPDKHQRCPGVKKVGGSGGAAGKGSLIHAMLVPTTITTKCHLHLQRVWVSHIAWNIVTQTSVYLPTPIYRHGRCWADIETMLLQVQLWLILSACVGSYCDLCWSDISIKMSQRTQ